MTPNILNLPAYTVQNVQETEHDYHVYVTAKDASHSCPHCHSTELYGHGGGEQLIKDLPSHGKRVGMYVTTRRFRCRRCGKTFMEPLPGIDEKRWMTNRLIDYIGKQSPKRTFTSIAEDVGVTEGTIRGIFRDYINELEKTVRFETPQWMGIDEIHIIKKPRCVISNLQHNTVVELLQDRNKPTVARYLFQLKGKSDVKYVAMDMWNPCRDAVKSVLPNANIVIDKFHVVRMANEAMERVRKSLRSSLQPKQRRTLMHDRFILLKRQKMLLPKETLLLDTWLDNHKDLNDAYHLKEWFFDIWDTSANKGEAIQRYQEWAQDAAQHEAFQFILTAMNNWQEEIFGHFDHQITNAYTESLNNLIRVMNRLGRGYSFEALRAKILFTGSVHKIKRPTFMKVAEPISRYNDTSRVCAFIQKPEEINYGADISTLAQLIESGEL